MAKKPIPRFLVPTLGALALAGALAVHASRNGITLPDWIPVTIGPPAETKPSILPPEDSGNDSVPRSDADLLSQYQGQPVPEILTAIGSKEAPANPNEKALTFSAPENLDPYLPRFIPEENAQPLSGDDGIVYNGELLLTSNGKPIKTSFLSTIGGRRLLPADFDSDGDLDFFVGRAGGLPHSLLRKNDDSSFTDVTTPAGLLDFRELIAGAWVDYDRDGRLDLSLLEKAGDSNVVFSLFRNVDGNRFEYSRLNGLTDTPAHFLWHDVDGDGFPDLIFSGTKSGIQIHLAVPSIQQQSWDFVNATSIFGFDQVPGGGPLAAGDLDQDGVPEIITASADTVAVFTRSSDDFFAPYTDIAEPLGIEAGIAAPSALLVEDFDLDAFLDIAVVGGTAEAPAAKAWWNRSGTRLREIPGAAGLAGSLRIDHLGLFDVEGDGLPDLLAFSADGSSASLLTPTPETVMDRKSIAVGFLPGENGSGSHGIGSMLKITVRDDSRTLFTFQREVDEAIELIGIGNALEIDSLTVTWPDRAQSQTTFKKLPVNSLLMLGADPDSTKTMPLVDPQVTTGKAPASAESDS